MRWDAHWLIWTISNQWLRWLRQFTFATYYIVTFTLFVRLFQAEWKQVGFAFLEDVLHWLDLILLAAAFVLLYR